MMPSHNDALVDTAQQRSTAVGAFSVYNLETTLAVVQAAEEAGTPVILQAGASAFAYSGVEPLAALTLAAARSSSVPVGVHLDHCRDLETLRRCVDLGYSSVMMDGSHLPFEQNVALTRAAVEIAHPAGCHVEGELGAVPGDEDQSGQAPSTGMTDPDLVAQFIRDTGVDWLAVAVGNVHGLSVEPPRIDLERLAAIKAESRVPLVLHGASGMADDTISRCISLGVAKINVNAELRGALLSALAIATSDGLRSDALPDVLGPGITAARTVAMSKIELFTSPASRHLARTRN